MEELIRQRVNEILLSHCISINKFSDGDSALQNRLSRQINRGASITAETLFILLDKFKDVSAEWLLRGEGIMTKNDSENINDNFDKSQYVSKDKYESIVNLLAGVTSNLKEAVLENKKLYKEIDELKSRLKTAKSA
ncbi:hypothetical protein NXX87_13560 [Bacteroides faecis]|uniref:hypothetical protein n=1 Tax=Bacteroides faecis TaxID=674529 RepID=UPI00204D0132|nr:hypothetical protein [Bacteroides faecis]UVR67700.1 hypothetical protein NXW26_13600 [Bacteroides faecis]UVS37012.1 hypothetical protein NXX87_13560 [Bacteroides faecis]DAW36751.1 MAG TPA: protein-turn-helix DNA binding protein [Caudoviricetes sp.]